jgi:hypothetical protein|tara:strand:- start:9402 stop:9629 length:228 start_codon:yes stop_codon:yes gene_type:complete
MYAICLRKCNVATVFKGSCGKHALISRNIFGKSSQLYLISLFIRRLSFVTASKVIAGGRLACGFGNVSSTIELEI